MSVNDIKLSSFHESFVCSDLALNLRLLIVFGFSTLVFYRTVWSKHTTTTLHCYFNARLCLLGCRAELATCHWPIVFCIGCKFSPELGIVFPGSCYFFTDSALKLPELLYSLWHIQFFCFLKFQFLTRSAIATQKRVASCDANESICHSDVEAHSFEAPTLMDGYFRI